MNFFRNPDFISAKQLSSSLNTMIPFNTRQFWYWTWIHIPSNIYPLPCSGLNINNYSSFNSSVLLLFPLQSQVQYIQISCLQHQTENIIMLAIWVLLWTECLCPLPKFAFWSPNHQYDGIRRQGLQEVIRLKWGPEGKTPLKELVLF